tara:strand:- start:3260 stop:3988 length:729 start_codon:yes stop_codon:yes gene_type:complete
MRILNLGCGNKTCNSNEVISMDWSVSLVLKRNFLLRIILSKLLSKERYKKIKNLPNNIIVHNLKKGIPYENNSIDAVYHSHLLEHLDRSNVRNFLKEVFRVLKPNGIQRIVVPDLYILCKSYVDNYEHCNLKNEINEKHDDFISAILEQSVRKEAYGSSKQKKIMRILENFILGDARKRGETHQWMYDKVNLSYLLREIGFKNIKVQTFSKSDISNWKNYRLDLDNEDREYKSGSLYLEARK